jgi:tellurite resistance protein TehA-like permease
MSASERQAAPPQNSLGLATMHPASFALVMATGIVSIACEILDHPLLARALLWANLTFYVVLWSLTVARIVRFPERVLADISHHGRSVGFFTIVAATCVVGSQMLVINDAWRTAAAFWAFGILLWAVVTYTVFTALTVKGEKPPLAEGINGGWLVSVVAAQSVAVLGSQLAPGFDVHVPQVLFFCLGMWLGGGMLYIWIISLIFYRYTFFVMSPSDLAPPYWINMGAVAISTLAGATLIEAAPDSRLLQDLLPFLKGFTLLFWATATWWIPMLVILGAWRHVYRRFPLGYDPLYWGAVFPLGMYTVCTFRLAGAIDAPYLLIIPRVFLYIALAAWGATMIGALRLLVRHSRVVLSPN